MANSIGAYSANILARFNAAYTANQGNTSSATSTGDALAKLKNATSDASSPSNAGNDGVILNLSAAAQQLLASLQGSSTPDNTQGNAAQNDSSQTSLVQLINQQVANQPSLASYLGIGGQNTTVNGLNFTNGFGADGSANGLDAFGSIGDAGGAIQQFQQWLSQPLQANLERAIERQKESSPLNDTKADDKSKAPDQTASDTSSTTDATRSASDPSATGGAGTGSQASA
ncbi:MAG: hypothetical protein E6Q98_23250 [Rhodospirillaceae bacterium]|nr:MAG: hypothetical protein E6Q98_23250 [Rhodospirillaceae bacterium]